MLIIMMVFVLMVLCKRLLPIMLMGLLQMTSSFLQGYDAIEAMDADAIQGDDDGKSPLPLHSSSPQTRTQNNHTQTQTQTQTQTNHGCGCAPG